MMVINGYYWLNDLKIVEVNDVLPQVLIYTRCRAVHTAATASGCAWFGCPVGVALVASSLFVDPFLLVAPPGKVLK